MTATTITTVKAELQLVIANAAPTALGKVDIPIEAATHVDSHGELMLRPVTSVAEVRDFVQQVFQRTETTKTAAV